MSKRHVYGLCMVAYVRGSQSAVCAHCLIAALVATLFCLGAKLLVYLALPLLLCSHSPLVALQRHVLLGVHQEEQLVGRLAVAASVSTRGNHAGGVRWKDRCAVRGNKV